MCALGTYYRNKDADIHKGLEYYETAMRLSKQVQNAQVQCIAMREASQAQWQLGKYREAETMAREMRQLTQMHGLFYYEAHAIRAELLCRVSRGDLAPCLRLSAEARSILAICGLQGGLADLMLINSDAEVHFLKTEYAEARDLYSRTSGNQPPHAQAYDRFNTAYIDNEVGFIETNKVRQDLDAVKSTFESIPSPTGVAFCEIILAYVDIREGHLLKARSSLQRLFALGRGNEQEITILCLNKLGDITCQLSDIHTTFGWALILLGFALTTENTLAMYDALRRLGDIYLAQDDDKTALSLFQVAFDGFTAMDIHRSKGDCALRMGDICHRLGDTQKATELWEIARPSFVRCLQTEDVARIDERIQAV